MDLHYEVLPGTTKKVFVWFRQQAFIKQFYLAGGTAAALYFGHRTSRDLDFFSWKPFSSAKLQRELLSFGHWQTFKRERNTLTGALEKAKLSFFTIPDKPIKRLHRLDSLRLADPLDLALMKIMAISDRGTRRDFVDLYVLAQRFMPLEELIAWLPKKYGKWQYNLAHIIRSLGYFQDAEQEQMPHMIEPISWKEVKSYFHKESERLMSKFLK